MKPEALLRRMFEAAIASAQPARCVPEFLPDLATIRGRVLVVGAGKASAAMAQAAEQHWKKQPGFDRVSGLVVTRYGYAVPCERIEIAQAAHPVPDAAGEAAAARMLELVQGLSADDFVLCLISGGGSALLPLAATGLSLQDKQQINRALLASGATIAEMNTVRRHLSAIKGGRLAAACHPAQVLTLLISDVPGDHPMDIASGPTVADPSTCADALSIVRRFGIALADSVKHLLESGAGESLKPGDPRLARSRFQVVAAPQMALEAAAAVAQEAGYKAHILSDAIEGEAKDVGKALAAIALQIIHRQQPFAPPCVLLSGGETTVTLQGDGRGGRNVEYLLSQTIALHGQAGIYGLAGDTDGVDGAEEIAGAVMGPQTLARAWALGLRPVDELANNNAHGFFERLGDSVITGPTLTNVNDFRALLIDPSLAA